MEDKMGLQDRNFLIDKGVSFSLCNEDFVEVSFMGIQEFYKYCPLVEFGVNVAAITKLNYEPGRGYYLEDGVDLMAEVPNAGYENLIDNTQTLLNRKNNVYYGLSDDVARTLKQKRDRLAYVTASGVDQGDRDALLLAIVEILNLKDDQFDEEIKSVLTKIKTSRSKIVSAGLNKHRKHILNLKGR